MPFTVPADFIDSFKIGDNINYNLKILKELYDPNQSFRQEYYFRKLIIILNTSITEALLYDFVENRIIRANRTETLFEEILDKLNIKKLDKFEHYIAQAEKHNLFKMKDVSFYNAMHVLKKLRNRVHIQNAKRLKPADESEAFTDNMKLLSEKVLEKTVKILHRDFQRREEYRSYVKDFEFPWDEYFSN
ncbi:hypothetical protein GW765_01650 [Candidatus Parcubacteria bacterium]|nr:hypothetical protein [Candidatus Parcubacteria bacterium]